MKRVLSFVFALALSAAVFTSCGDKCTSCEATYDSAGGTSVTVPAQNFCGSKSQVEEFETSYQTAAEATATAAGGVNVQVTCTEQ